MGAAYAMDDLHRLEVIITKGYATRREYAAAKLASKRLLQVIRRDPFGLLPLEEELNRFDRIRVKENRLAQAVKLMRHVHAIRGRRQDSELSPEGRKLVTTVE